MSRYGWLLVLYLNLGGVDVEMRDTTIFQVGGGRDVYGRFECGSRMRRI